MYAQNNTLFQVRHLKCPLGTANFADGNLSCSQDQCLATYIRKHGKALAIVICISFLDSSAAV